MPSTAWTTAPTRIAKPIATQYQEGTDACAGGCLDMRAQLVGQEPPARQMRHGRDAPMVLDRRGRLERRAELAAMARHRDERRPLGGKPIKNTVKAARSTSARGGITSKEVR